MTIKQRCNKELIAFLKEKKAYPVDKVKLEERTIVDYSCTPIYNNLTETDYTRLKNIFTGINFHIFKDSGIMVIDWVYPVNFISQYYNRNLILNKQKQAKYLPSKDKCLDALHRDTYLRDAVYKDLNQKTVIDYSATNTYIQIARDDAEHYQNLSNILSAYGVSACVNEGAGIIVVDFKDTAS